MRVLFWDKLVRYTFISLAAIAGFLGYEGGSSVLKGTSYFADNK